jgi:hypothetical protein
MCVLDVASTSSLFRPGHESSTRSARSVQFIRRWGLSRESTGKGKRKLQVKNR